MTLALKQDSRGQLRTTMDGARKDRGTPVQNRRNQLIIQGGATDAGLKAVCKVLNGTTYVLVS